MNAINHAIAVNSYTPTQSSALIRKLALVWILFLFASTLYCHGHALLIAGDYANNLSMALSCASRDWLAWALLSPLLVHLGRGKDLSNKSGLISLAGLWLGGIATTAALRLLLEDGEGTTSSLEVLWIYLPRYLFVAILIPLGGFVYLHYKRAPRRLFLPEGPEEVLAEAPRRPSSLIAYKGSARVAVPLHDILCITAAGNYLEIYTSDNNYLMRGTMKMLESQLAPATMVRVHRCHLVTLSAIVSVTPKAMDIELINGMKVRLGKSYCRNLPHFNKGS